MHNYVLICQCPYYYYVINPERHAQDVGCVEARKPLNGQCAVLTVVYLLLPGV